MIFELINRKNAMKINIQSSYNITFGVQAFWNEEGGMGSDSFGKQCDNIQTALVQLELAQVAEPNVEWIIVCGVEKQVSEVKK